MNINWNATLQDDPQKIYDEVADVPMVIEDVKNAIIKHDLSIGQVKIIFDMVIDNLINNHKINCRCTKQYYNYLDSVLPTERPS